MTYIETRWADRAALQADVENGVDVMAMFGTQLAGYLQQLEQMAGHSSSPYPYHLELPTQNGAMDLKDSLINQLGTPTGDVDAGTHTYPSAGELLGYKAQTLLSDWED